MDSSSIILQDNLIIRSGGEPADLSFKILPVSDKQSFWINSSPGIRVSVRNYDNDSNVRVLSVIADDMENAPADGKIWIKPKPQSTALCKA